MTAILPKELLTATLGGLSLLVVSGGSDGDVVVQQSDGTYAPETLVTGNVFGPSSATDNAIARFDATTGKLLQNCVVTIGDTGNIAGLGTVSCGAITASDYIYGTSAQFSALGAFGGYGAGSATLAVQALNSSTIGMNIRGQSGQTADLFKCKTSANTDVFTVGPTGAITASGTITLAGDYLTYPRISTAGNLVFYARDANRLRLDTSGATVASSGSIGFNSGTNLDTGSQDAYFVRNSASSIGVKGSGGIDGTLTTGAITASGDITLAASQRLFVSNGALTGNYLSSGATAVFANNSVAQGGWNTNGMFARRLFIDYANADICLARASASNLGVYAADGTTPAAITCGTITASGLVCMGIYTVATLPSASANAYKEANVSDALAPAMGAAVVGGGSVKTKVRSNGTDWTVCGI